MPGDRSVCDPLAMTLFRDGDALSDWECHILQEIEQDMEGSDPRLAAFLAHGDPAPLYVLATCLVAGEAAAALTVLTALTVSAARTMASLATIGASLWLRAVHGGFYSIA
jgi:Protein of unknown function (DUF3040)